MHTENFLELRNISKHFGGVQALKHVDFSITRGEIHCLVGENGSGKSTLIKIMSGVHAPEPGGEILIEGKAYPHLTPHSSIQEGIQVIYQDLSLFPNLTVAENIGIGQYMERGRTLIDAKKIRTTALEAMSKIGVSLHPDRVVEQLSIADRQIVAICRAIAINARLVIMDEPTASLTRQEVEALMRVVRDLQTKQISTLFVSHRLYEIMEIAERVTILRDGEKIGVYDVKDLNDRKMAYLMTGEEIDYRLHTEPVNQERVILEVKHLSKKGNYHDISLQLHEGEILGIIGVLGSGRTEFALSLFGMNPPDSGEILLDGIPVHLRSNKEAIAHGISYVPEDRLTLGVVMQQSIQQNLLLTMIEKFLNAFKLLDKARMVSSVTQWIQDLRIKASNPQNPVNTLSGGNQQKLVLAKWIATQPKVFLLDSPTVGVDIAAKSGIYEIVKRLTFQGMGILMISDEVPEVLYNCHRILLMRKGRLVGEFFPEHISELELNQKINEDTSVEYSQA
ncbi:ABC transporter related protein [Candidatus Vecturithrix granuli]|uniref:ABC transporter related protein n=1 Tax=Vecturithrix granuli TaxID=1499967 RepID=A0A081C3I6_VECG1|nr:ABC transporter related protein [Candidatus Vecturithrix granuli]